METVKTKLVLASGRIADAHVPPGAASVLYSPDVSSGETVRLDAQSVKFGNAIAFIYEQRTPQAPIEAIYKAARALLRELGAETDHAEVSADGKEQRFKLLTGCARCTGDHADLVFKPLTHAMEPRIREQRCHPACTDHLQHDEEGYPVFRWTWWAPCPTNGEPILYRVFPGGADL